MIILLFIIFLVLVYIEGELAKKFSPLCFEYAFTVYSKTISFFGNLPDKFDKVQEYFKKRYQNDVQFKIVEPGKVWIMGEGSSRHDWRFFLMRPELIVDPVKGDVRIIGKLNWIFLLPPLFFLLNLMPMSFLDRGSVVAVGIVYMLAYVMGAVGCQQLLNKFSAYYSNYPKQLDSLEDEPQPKDSKVTAIIIFLISLASVMAGLAIYFAEHVSRYSKWTRETEHLHGHAAQLMSVWWIVPGILGVWLSVRLYKKLESRPMDFLEYLVILLLVGLIIAGAVVFYRYRFS
ncbi:MAG: hypothetical protein ACKVQC_08735 [Elusimicrobiota bacterium]